MPLRSARRLPKKYNRPVSQQSRNLAQRRRGRQAKWRQERLRRWWRKMQRLWHDAREFCVRWFLVAMVLLVMGAGLLVLFSPLLRVANIRIARTEPRLNIEVVKKALAPLFQRHLLLLSDFEVQDLLREHVVDLDTVTVEKIYPSELLVTVQLDPIVAKLQIVAPDTEEAAETASGVVHIDYLTNEGIYVTSDAPQSPDLLTVQLVDWGARPVPGDHLLDLPILENITLATQALQRQFEQPVQKQTVFLRAQEFHLTLPNYTLWLDLRSPLEQQLLRYRIFLQSINPEEVTEYIDLRVADRVIYR